jgi:hypothetical protein
MKNPSQCFWSLFTGAQEISNLACDLCTNGWEKGHTPFVKVVEGWLIYNFPIYRLDHFSSKIWRKTGSNRAKWNSNGPTCATRATSRTMPSRRVDPPAWCAHAEVRLRPPVRALCHGHCAPVRSTRSRGQGSVPRGPPSHAGRRTASRHWPRCRPLVAAPLPPYPAMSRPYRDRVKTWCPSHRPSASWLPLKAVVSSPRASAQ